MTYVNPILLGGRWEIRHPPVLLENLIVEILLLIFSRYMTYYNCAKFHCFSIFSFGVSRGGQNAPPPPLGTNIAKHPLGL